MNRAIKLILASGVVFGIAACSTQETKSSKVNSEYIPRQVLFGNPDVAHLRLSPDGKYIAYLSAHNGVLNIWVQEFGKPETAKPVTHDSKRGIFNFNWTYLPNTILFSQDVGGDENFGLYALNVSTGEVSQITKPGQVTSQVEAVSHLRPNEVVIKTNERDPKFFDYKILNLSTKSLTDLFTNTENFAGILFDGNYNPVAASQSQADGSATIFLWNKKLEKFEAKTTIPFEDNLSSSLVSASNDGRVIYLLDSRGRDKTGLVEWNLKTGRKNTLASDPRSDISDVDMHPKTGRPLSASSNYLRREMHFLDSDYKKHFENIQK